MITPLSPNTQAILLLTAPLPTRRKEAEVLSLDEYNQLARVLRSHEKQPADLLGVHAESVLKLCSGCVDEGRLRALLARGFLMAQAVDRWNARAIWVISRADPQYPRRWKTRLREEAPPLLYGCGDPALLSKEGLVLDSTSHACVSPNGETVAVLAGNLEAAALARENRAAIRSGRLTLVSPFLPAAEASGRQAIARDKLLRALADEG